MRFFFVSIIAVEQSFIHCQIMGIVV